MTRLCYEETLLLFRSPSNVRAQMLLVCVALWVQPELGSSLLIPCHLMYMGYRLLLNIINTSMLYARIENNSLLAHFALFDSSARRVSGRWSSFRLISMWSIRQRCSWELMAAIFEYTWEIQNVCDISLDKQTQMNYQKFHYVKECKRITWWKKIFWKDTKVVHKRCR